MSEPIDIEIPQHIQDQGELDNPLRAIIVVNSPSVPEGEMEERLLDSIQSFDDMNDFFDKFDENVAIPNEGHIKYEVGSDGLVVFVVDSTDLKNESLKWIDQYVTNFEDKLVDNVEGNNGQIDDAANNDSDSEEDNKQKKKKKVTK